MIHLWSLRMETLLRPLFFLQDDLFGETVEEFCQKYNQTILGLGQPEPLFIVNSQSLFSHNSSLWLRRALILQIYIWDSLFQHRSTL
jgi:hypothetical protein